jgi:hypothetical protein
MTNRVSGNGVTISVVKSVDGLAVNPLPHRLQAAPAKYEAECVTNGTHKSVALDAP